jgi:predicted naringenin-chalcone synthase
MTMPTIYALATGVPGIRYSQAEVFDYLSEHQGGINRRARAIFERAGVAFRHIIVDKSFYAQERSTGDRNERYLAEALPLGEATIQRCLDSSGYSPADIDDFLVVSCTGYDIPGLDLRLAGRLNMRPDLRRTCVLGMGCYGVFPALLRACEAAAQRSGRLVLVLALELCSLHLQLNGDIEDVVASALFADGAGAVLIGNGRNRRGTTTRDDGPKQFCVLDSATHCDYRTFDHMAFYLTDHGFRMRLSAYVPDVLAAQVETFVDGLLGRHDLLRSDVRFWAIHPGGSKILDYLQARLGLNDEQLGFSRAVLHDYGNMSSPTVLFVLDRIQCAGSPASGDYGVLLAFGPGLTMEGVLVQW